jgi:ABC-type lipoprotein export system ATPase subunit
MEKYMSDLKYPYGSEWRKWDLHVHTPSSLIHSYPGPDPWESFITDLETLPPEFKVIGINDYIFIDGYKRVLEEKAKGRLANIDLILPVIELRLDKFGGSSGHLSRVNYHIIFSNEVEPEIIEHQFLNALCSKYILSPQYDNIITCEKWAAIPTKRSLEDLGRLIIDSVPEEERCNFDIPLIEGFNNLCLSLDSVQSALKSHYFEGKYLTAVGKTEWADIKWNNHSIADKKNIINGAHFVFISAKNPEAWEQARRSLKDGGVNCRLLDCSDAHALSTASVKDRLGKCFTWIKADPTFQGLRQLLYEPEARVFVGDKPHAISHVIKNSTKYISMLEFERTELAKDEEIWFSSNIPLNHGLVAIIGNKGNGKSALADILALLGNTHNPNFSFLNRDRFREPKAKLDGMFSASITWKSGLKIKKTLSEPVDQSAVELVKYIPQKYLESICSDLKESNKIQFDHELKEVIFSHVDDTARLGKETLSELINYLTNEKEERISQLVNELKGINIKIVFLENQRTEEYRKGLVAQLEQLNNELKAHQEAKPIEIKKPEEDLQVKREIEDAINEISDLQRRESELSEEINCKKEILRKAILQIASAEKLLTRIDNLERQLSTFYNESSEDEIVLELDVKEVVTLKIDRKLVHDVKNGAETLKLEARTSLNEDYKDSLAAQIKTIRDQMKAKHLSLDESNRKYQSYLQQLKDWQRKHDEIIGSAENAASIKGMEAKLAALDDLPAQHKNLTTKRNNLVHEIFKAKEQLLEEYRKLYSPVQDFINKNSMSSEPDILQFFASITVDGFVDGLLEMINKGRKGSFQGEQEGRERLKELVLSNDFSTENGVQYFLECVQEHLEYDKRDGNNRKVLLRDQLRQQVEPEDLYDFLYGLNYLQPRFELRWQNKPLDQLSPGERGNLLLVFYLLIDKRDTPLIIDQPEENLDNQTIATMLVPAIKKAKESRQIIIVTHNPNLAVVCDADQIIHSQLDKTNGNRVIYTSGAIEDPKITKLIVDVLEGTKAAFDLRDAKYEVLERLH